MWLAVASFRKVLCAALVELGKHVLCITPGATNTYIFVHCVSYCKSLSHVCIAHSASAKVAALPLNVLVKDTLQYIVRGPKSTCQSSTAFVYVNIPVGR